MEKFKLMKVFDCLTMPESVCDEFYLQAEKGNDCYVSYHIDERGEDNISDWLLDNGGEEEEVVIIKHHW